MIVRKQWSRTLIACAMLVLLGAVPAIAQEDADDSGGPTITYQIAPGTVAESDTTGMAAAYMEFYSEGGFEAWFGKTRLGRSGAGELFLNGGPFMWPLLGSIVVGLVFILERLWTLSRARVNTRKLMFGIQKSLRSEGVDAAIRTCERTRGPIAAILHAGLLKTPRGPQAVEKAIETAGAIEMAFLERGLSAIAAVVNVAPMLGFLGTVSGMINAFEAIAASDQVSAKLVASGISEALITTASGLVIAIPTSLFHSYFVGQVDKFIVEMEETSAELINELTELGL
jgi:biopolymer transport protein ExbB